MVFFFFLNLVFLFLIEIYLIYSVSGEEHNDSFIYILFQFFPIIGYYKILNIVPCAIQ